MCVNLATYGFYTFLPSSLPGKGCMCQFHDHMTSVYPCSYHRYYCSSHHKCPSYMLHEMKTEISQNCSKRDCFSFTYFLHHLWFTSLPNGSNPSRRIYNSLVSFTCSRRSIVMYEKVTRKTFQAHCCFFIPMKLKLL